MRLTDPFVLADDLELFPVAELPPATRDALDHSPGDWVVSRPRSRTPSRLVNDDLAALLARFRGGATIADAIAGYAHGTDREPAAVLDDALPNLRGFMNAAWLVPVGSPSAQPIAQSLAIGSAVAGYRIVDCIRVLEDTQIYQAQRADGARVALKLVARPVAREIDAQLDAEVRALERLDGAPAPRLHERGATDAHAFLAIEWCEGGSASVLSEALRRRGAHAELHALCVAIADAYVALHERGVIHGDVHPGNLLVDEARTVRIIDFGLAVVAGAGSRAQPRGGVTAFFDPQQAADRRAGRRPAAPDERSEQYAVAVLLYALFTGQHYLPLAADRETSLAAIIEQPPIAFAEAGVEAPELEVALRRALSKSPDDRFGSMAEFAAEVARAPAPRTLAAPAPSERAARRDDAERREYVDAHVARLGFGAPEAVAHGGRGPHASVTFGSAGVAQGLLRIALALGDADVLTQADQWATKAVAQVDAPGAFDDDVLEIGAGSVGRLSPWHAPSGVHAVRALVAQAMGDVLAVRTSVEAYLSALDVRCDRLDLTLGRSSVVLTNALLLDALAALRPAAQMDDLERRLRASGDAALAEVWAALACPEGIGPASTMSYLGVAHGWAGVCLATLEWSDATGAPLPGELRARLGELGDLADPIGAGLRWPIQTHARGKHHNFLNSWCNGAPGYVFLWNAAHARFGDDRFARLAHGAATHAWERRDGHGTLCCGSAGRAYAMLNQHRHSSDPIWLERARELGELERRASFAPPLRDSLYKGEVGSVVLAADLSAPHAARMPFFERDR